MKNKHRLSRHIPEKIKREVRRRSKFGCVVCRCAIYQYEHINPEFSDATAHDPDNICLLCGGCHDKVTRGRLSKETVKAKYLQVMHSSEILRPFEELDLSANIRIKIGTAIFEYAQSLIRVNGRDLFSLTPPKDGAAFPTLNGLFCDRYGQEVLRITDNVWEGCIDAWDIKVIGKEVSVKTIGGRTAISFVINPPDKIIIKDIDMYLDNCHVTCNKDGILIGRVHGKHHTYIGIGDFECKGSEVGIDVDSRNNGFVPHGISIVGGQGINLDGTGIRIGVGAAVMLVANLTVWHQ